MELKVSGMSCGGCVKSVARIIAKHANLQPEDVQVDLESGKALFDVSSSQDTTELLEKLRVAGFESTVEKN
jgi:copper chaperone CopZ